MKINIPAALLRRISDSDFVEVRIEEAIDCEGGICNRAYFEHDGTPAELPPHYHMVVIGRSPDAGPRYYAIGGELPEPSLESSHR